jgi:hypothetical protein
LGLALLGILSRLPAVQTATGPPVVEETVPPTTDEELPPQGMA